ncbi:hypothetical protein V565_170730, partial [Rhizoctonia solani 123E]
MPPAAHNLSDSPVSNISYGSLRTVDSSGSSLLPGAANAVDITWGTLASGNSTTRAGQSSRASTESRARTPSNLMQHRAPSPPSSVSSIPDVQQSAPVSPPYSPPSLQQHVLEQPLDTMLSSLTVAGSSQKRPSPLPAPAGSSKRARSATPNNTTNSQRAGDSESHNPASRSPSQRLSRSATPITTRADSPASIRSVSSTSSRRARASPGTSVWKHMQQLKAARSSSSRSTPQPTSPVNTSGGTPIRERMLSPLSNLAFQSDRAMSPEQQTIDEPEAERNRPGRAHRQPIVGDLSTTSGEHTIDQLLLNPSHDLYKHVFVTCLMHRFYRPLDPSTTIWILMDRSTDPTLWRPQPNDGEPVPTHVLGLLELPDEDITLLIWGKCKMVADARVRIQLTFYDSAARLHSEELMEGYVNVVWDHVRSSIPVEYQVEARPTVKATWTEYFLSMSEPELKMAFCQMISTVVHELPFDVSLNHGPPVQPVWAVEMVQAQIRELLGQVARNKLRLQDIVSGHGSVPGCIYIHGDSFETDGSGVGDVPDELDVPEEANEPQAPLDSLWDRTEAWVNQRAALQSMGESNWYLRAGSEMVYPARAATSQRAPSTDTEIDTDQQSFIKSTHSLFIDSHGCTHTARIAYWQQLRESTPSVECISVMTTHLWLSSLLAQPTRNVFYIDPLLATALVQRYNEDPLVMEENVPELFERQKLWPRMGSTVNILALIHLQGLLEPDSGELSWFLLDMKAANGRVRSVELLLPPCTSYNKERFASLVTRLIGALNCVLPRRTLVAYSSKVHQQTNTLILPQPFTQESVVLVMMAYVLGKMLGQPVHSVNSAAMRQGICFYYNQALRIREPDLSFPWHGLTDWDGELLTEENAEEVRQKRFNLASNREPSPFETFPRQRSFSAAVATAGPSEPFFLELSQTRSDHPEGILVGTSGRSVEELEKATFFGHYPSFPDDDEFPDTSPEGSCILSLAEFVALIHSIGGPESKDAHMLLLTGKHNGKRITLDWLKDVTYPLPEWIFAGFDLDSLSLTCYEPPKFLEAGSYNPYPNRALSLTNRNELTVNIDGERIEMHTCPNFCIMTFGANNQFRLLVFFPGCRNRVGRLWRNIPRESEMSDWYHAFRSALLIVRAQVPHHWQHAVERTIEALPTTYQMAADQANHGGGQRSFVGHRIEPHILNLVFPVLRAIINTTPHLAKYRGYFFHLCGINLKLATMNIHGREDSNPLNYAFLIFRFIDWYAQNPHDIIADVGLALNVHRPSLPEELKRSTLLWRYGPLRELLRLGYQKPHQDRYCLSYVVSGARAIPLSAARLRAGIIKFQAYMKDMLATYRHRDKSVGANFTVNEALGMGHREKFTSQMNAFQEVMAVIDTYGLRTEVRLTAWGANRYMKMDARDPLDRLIGAKAILCYPTQTLVNFKVMLSKGWSSIIARQGRLPLASRRSPEVVLLTSVIAYWLKSLVKRPDEMSATTQMVHNLYLAETAERHGLPFLRTPALDEDGLRVSYLVEAEKYKIVYHSNVIVPGGNRIKSSRAVRGGNPMQPTIASRPPSPAGDQEHVPLWGQESERFLQTLVNVHLPHALWTMFPKDRFRPDIQVNNLKKPFKLASWSRIVDHLNTTTEIAGKFIPSFNMLFPEDWSTDETEGQLARYDRDLLQRIRDHVSTKPVEERSLYSQELRKRI